MLEYPDKSLYLFGMKATPFANFSEYSPLLLATTLSIILSACVWVGDPLSDMESPEIINPIRISMDGGGWSTSQQKYLIRPDGSGYYELYDGDEPTKKLEFKSDKTMFAKITELLGPLQNFAGDEVGIPFWEGEMILCDDYATDSSSALIVWGGIPFEEMTTEKDLESTFKLYWGCRSSEADAAKSRIERAIEIISRLANVKQLETEKSGK